ncbi:MAG: hypothetical protein B7Z80_10805 [Rhodospirillales bacterium 20-64-7]|nr:MAG: hypothetical protein B7Z80_10805 [Rhodospirillales bacterium 20-64-7]HQT77042.1 GspH/FimT family pseudopilin [Rhodopila sp.]
MARHSLLWHSPVGHYPVGHNPVWARWRRSRRAGTAGFTLIETLVVLVILGLALGIVAGFANRGHTGLDLTTAADDLASALRLARARAIARQAPSVFAPTAGGHGYVLDGRAKTLPSSLVVSLAGLRSIRFAPDGSSSGGTIRLLQASASRSVRVDWLTGRVTVAAP